MSLLKPTMKRGGSRPPNSYGFINPRQIEKMWRDEFDWVYWEMDDEIFPTIHPDVSGRRRVGQVLSRQPDGRKEVPPVLSAPRRARACWRIFTSFWRVLTRYSFKVILNALRRRTDRRGLFAPNPRPHRRDQADGHSAV